MSGLCFPDGKFAAAMQGRSFAAGGRAVARQPQAAPLPAHSAITNGPDLAARVRLLEDEAEKKDERIRHLECELGLDLQAPVFFGFTPKEAVIFGVLMKRKIAFKSTFMAALFSDRPDDEPQEKIIDVWVCHMRRKLEPFDVHIETQWGQGYFMRPSSKKRVEELIAEMGDTA